MSRFAGYFAALTASTLMFTAVGCGKSSADGSARSHADQHGGTAEAQGDPSHSGEIQLAGGDVSLDGGVTPAGYFVPGADPFKFVLAKLQPLHVLVGTWRGVTVRAIGGAKAIESPEWSWDFLSDSLQPALVLTSKTSPYLHKARLTFLADRRVFHCVVSDANGGERVYEGNFTQPPQEAPSSNGDLQRSFKLRLVQVTPMPQSDELVFSQENNDRYLLEIHRTSDGSLKHYDTVQTVREGGSISIEPEKFGGHRCIVSGGMGAIPVSHEGKTYHVCCEGCKAAFLANPMRWIAAASESARHP
ncbi:MAG: hypothetical protein WD648_12745 [Planctomycetaceae bacterium]